MKTNETTIGNPRVIVAFEVAKKLFEMGFDEPCRGHYGKDSKHLYDWEVEHDNIKEMRNSEMDTQGQFGVVAAPTIDQATNWLLMRAFGFKGEVQGFYGKILKGHAVDRTLMADFLFEMSKQITTNGMDRVAEATGNNIAEIALLLYPDVKLEDKFPGL